jgi:hypothetical protein
MVQVGRPEGDKSLLSNLVKRMNRKDVDPLTPLIDKYYARRGTAPSRLRKLDLDLEERPRPGGRLSPSMMGGCQRAAVFKFVKMPATSKRIDPETEAIFEDGNWRHHKWQSLFQDMERVLGSEVIRVISIEEDCEIDDLYVAGSLDLLVEIADFGRLLIDIKGINDAGFQRVVAADAPLEKHVHQLITYLKARRINLGALLYENKNNQHWRCYLVRRATVGRGKS